ncbi:MAG: HEAT repeat domain-containing protein [Gammaproteobacteria bacterium]
MVVGRTPLRALLLAPVVLLVLVVLWSRAIVPLYRYVWYSDTVLQWRLGSERPEARIDAARAIAGSRSQDQALVTELVSRLQTDESPDVRAEAARALGGLGARRKLPDEAVAALSGLVTSAQDDALRSAAIDAIGASAAENRYTDDVVERIAAVFAEPHLEWLYRRAATALGKIGAAQPLPDGVVDAMNQLFESPVRAGEREYMVQAFGEASKGRGLEQSTLDTLAAAYDQETNRRIRVAIIYALAYSARDYPRSESLLQAAMSDADGDVANAARSGLRIIEANRNFAGQDPLSIAMDRTRQSDVRVRALQIIRSTPVDPAAYESIVALSSDPNADVAIAAFGMFQFVGYTAGPDFDERARFPALVRGMNHSDRMIRKAAYTALSSMAIHRPKLLRTAEFPALLEAGANDPDARVRVIVLATLLRAAGGGSARDSVIERGIDDPDPIVRANVVGWLGSPKTKTRRRDEFIERGSHDANPDVRAAAASAKVNFESRKRAWPIETWQLLRDGEFGEFGLRILLVLTIGTPVLICASFLIYFMARLLTYLRERRARAIATAGVMLVWVAASYGLGMLFFLAGLSGATDTGDQAIVTAIIWGVIAIYAALGWGLHFLVRR